MAGIPATVGLGGLIGLAAPNVLISAALLPVPPPVTLDGVPEPLDPDEEEAGCAALDAR